MLKPDAQAAKAVLAVSRQPLWSIVSTFLEDERLRTYEKLTQATDPVILHQLQGKAQFITDFLQLVRDAPRTLEKLGESTL